MLVDSDPDSDEGSDLYYLPQDHITLQPDVRVSKVQFSNVQTLPCGQQKLLTQHISHWLLPNCRAKPPIPFCLTSFMTALLCSVTTSSFSVLK